MPFFWGVPFDGGRDGDEAHRRFCSECYCHIVAFWVGVLPSSWGGKSKLCVRMRE